MAIYGVDGSVLPAVYAINGTALTSAYDIDGNLLEGDYDVWNTEYQHNVLLTRDEWKTEYRADTDVVPLLVVTDEHQYLNAAHKPTFDYLGLAIRWDEASALLNLGDVSGAICSPTRYIAMQSCLSAIPADRQINVPGNHDVWADATEGSSYSYSITDQWDALTGTYFDHAAWGNQYKYDNRGNGYVYDERHRIKYCMFADWYYGTSGGEVNQPYYKTRLTGDVAEYYIAMLSEVSEYDLIVLSHVQPLIGEYDWVVPPVDGHEQSVNHEAYTGTGCLGYDVGLDQMIADRKAKTSGTITDCDGVSHSYDFSSCTSDLLCWLSGHSHADRYAVCGGVPVVIFDAYYQDAIPMYMVNVDRTSKRLNVWKFDEANNTYNYQIDYGGTA